MNCICNLLPYRIHWRKVSLVSLGLLRTANRYRNSRLEKDRTEPDPTLWSGPYSKDEDQYLGVCWVVICRHPVGDG